MSPGSDLWLAEGILVLHFAVIAFNIFGLVVIPLGAWRAWSWVRAPLWRWLHVGSLAVVTLQAIAGRACFLTVWQDALAGRPEGEPLIMRLVNGLIFWPLPMWVFTTFYMAMFVYTLALIRLAPPRPWRGPTA